MQAMGLEVHSGALGMIEAQPGDVALLMDPQRDLTESEALAMADFLDSGGHLLLACGADRLGQNFPSCRRCARYTGWDSKQDGWWRMLRLPMPMWSALNGFRPRCREQRPGGYASRTADFASGLRACGARHTAGNHCPRAADHL